MIELGPVSACTLIGYAGHARFTEHSGVASMHAIEQPVHLLCRGILVQAQDLLAGQVDTGHHPPKHVPCGLFILGIP
jgi:hypothetical protein